MGIILVEHAVERKKGFLYYLNREGDLCEAEMKRGGTKKKKEDKEKE